MTFRRKLQAAYEQPTYAAAKRALERGRHELRLLNVSAVASLDEGLEETLTLHRLGVFAQVGTSLKTTNVIESIHARVRGSDGQGRSLANERSETAVAGHRIAGPGTTTQCPDASCTAAVAARRAQG